jgi:YbbR domain-containing protein
MKEKLTRNIGLKILSVILAAILWLVITNINDPIVPKEFDNVRVEILNADEITKLNQIYEILEGETIDFTVAARRKVADELSESDFRVTADLSKLSDVNAVKINISCPRYEDEITITKGMNEVLKVNLEEVEEKHFKVNVTQKGEPAEGYYVYEKTVSRLLSVSGPKSKIERIAEIKVDVDVSDATGSFRTAAKPKVLDKDGEEIDASNLTFSENFVTVNIGMYKTKIIDLKLDTKGKPANGYVMTNVEYDPKTIEIAAEDSILKSIDNLTVTESIEGASENIEKEVNLQDLLEDGVKLVGENQTAVVNITIEEATTKEVTIWPGDIDVRNKPDSINLAYLTTGPIKIKVTGPKNEMKDVSRDSIKPYIDLTGYSSGTYTLPIEADFKGYTSLSNSPTVNVYLIQ